MMAPKSTVQPYGRYAELLSYKSDDKYNYVYEQHKVFEM